MHKKYIYCFHFGLFLCKHDHDQFLIYVLTSLTKKLKIAGFDVLGLIADADRPTSGGLAVSLLFLLQDNLVANSELTIFFPIAVYYLTGFISDYLYKLKVYSDKL